MSDTPTEAGLPATGPRPKPYRLERIDGGRLPEIGPLLSASLTEFIDNLAGYLMIGLAQLAIVLPLVFVILLVIYPLASGMMVVGFVGSAVAGDALGKDIGGLVAALGSLGTVAVVLAAILLMSAMVGALVAPFQASAVRAIAAHQRGEGKLEFGAAFATVRQDFGKVAAGALLYTFGVLAGLFACYVPGIAFAILAGFMPTAIALHRRGAVDALRQVIATARANPSWYVVYALLSFGTAIVAANVPLIGPAFIAAFHVRVYRELYGDGDLPATAGA